jgi:hypothetical protein
VPHEDTIKPSAWQNFIRGVLEADETIKRRREERQRSLLVPLICWQSRVGRYEVMVTPEFLEWLDATVSAMALAA